MSHSARAKVLIDYYVIEKNFSSGSVAKGFFDCLFVCLFSKTKLRKYNANLRETDELTFLETVADRRVRIDSQTGGKISRMESWEETS